MIDRDGNAKIMDFDIARSLHTRGSTGTGVIIGTPEYMAPEQAEARDVDQRADIYALGAILFEMVTGRVPFEGETPLSIVLKHRSEPPADPQTLNSQVSAAVSGVILKCLEKSKERRYQSAAEVLEDLALAGPGSPAPGQATVKGKSSTTREITVKFNLRKLLVPGLVLAAAFIVGLALLVVGGRRDGSTRRQAAGAVAGFKTGAEGGRGRKVRLPTEAQPPAPPGDEQARTSRPSGPKASAIWSMISPFIKDPSKILSEKDAQELEKTLTEIKQKYPAEAAAFSQYIDGIKARMEEGKKQKEAGDVVAYR